MEFENLLLKTMDAMTLRGFTTSTKKTYLLNISRYLKFVSQKCTKPGEISAKEYILRLHSMKLANNSIRLKASCVLYLLKNVMKLKVTYLDVPKPKKYSTLPKVLSKSEIKILLNNISNSKHRFMIEFLYSTGLRLSEFINVKRVDIESDRNLVKVCLGKGKKDRYTLLSGAIKKHLVKYLCDTEFKTKYLFETNRHEKYSKRTIQKIIKDCSKVLNKKVTTHMFRHSFATHLLESGVDVRIIQKLLGHSSLETTMIYTRVANNILAQIVSPFDSI